MPTIAFSNDFMSGSSGTTMGRLMSFGAATTDNNITGLMSYGINPQLTGNARTGVISIMKGSVPTNLNSIDYGSRSADVLVQWTMLSGNFTATSPNTNPAVINSSFVSAIASGTATWFWWVTRDGGWFGYSGNTVFEQIAGTVGVTGSGADLEISSTSITAGQLFRVIDLRIQLATSFNY